MARTRAQSANQIEPRSPRPKDQGIRNRGIQKPKSCRITSRGTRRLAANLTVHDQRTPVAAKIISQKSKQRGTKRHIDEHDPSSVNKRLRQSQNFPGLSENLAATHSATGNSIDPISFWADKGVWPRQYFEMDHLLARKKSLLSLNRKRSSSASSATPSDQRPREEKSAPYRDPRYETLLATKGSFMSKSPLGITDESKRVAQDLLIPRSVVPIDSLFRDDIFESTCQKIHNRNEARVIQDITRLLVPSAESLATYGAKNLNNLIESVNEGWNNAVPLTTTRPQPDYSVGFKREAFSDEQLAKLSPFIGDFIAGDQSLFMATYYMYFPFLTCEVKCGAAALDVADRQNAHSMYISVRGVAELFRAVKRQHEVDRHILAFSISHDHRSVRIYGHYPVFEDNTIKHYRHTIRTFDFTELDGKEKWTSYQFTANLLHRWMPSHFKMICSAIDELPSNLDFDNPSLPATGLSQSLESHHLLQSDSDSALEESRTGIAKQEAITPSTSFTDQGAAKKRKGRKQRLHSQAT